MLSNFEQETLWDAWLSAEIRAGYFATLSTRYQRNQNWMVSGSLILSSGATVSLLTTSLPDRYAWIRPALTLLAAALSAWSLVAKNERNAIDCADLHFRWSILALEYEALWSKTYAEDAAEQLRALRKREAEISKSSTSMPSADKLMGQVQDNVVMHHQREMTA